MQSGYQMSAKPKLLNHIVSSYSSLVRSGAQVVMQHATPSTPEQGADVRANCPLYSKRACPTQACGRAEALAIVGFVVFVVKTTQERPIADPMFFCLAMLRHPQLKAQQDSEGPS